MERSRWVQHFFSKKKLIFNTELRRGVAGNENARYIKYFRYADEFGWTPDVVDNIPNKVSEALGIILAYKDKQNSDSQKLNSKKLR
mgnify:CR=1 FL=1